MKIATNCTVYCSDDIIAMADTIVGLVEIDQCVAKRSKADFRELCDGVTIHVGHYNPSAAFSETTYGSDLQNRPVPLVKDANKSYYRTGHNGLLQIVKPELLWENALSFLAAVNDQSDDEFTGQVVPLYAKRDIYLRLAKLLPRIYPDRAKIAELTNSRHYMQSEYAEPLNHVLNHVHLPGGGIYREFIDKLPDIRIMKKAQGSPPPGGITLTSNMKSKWLECQYRLSTAQDAIQKTHKYTKSMEQRLSKIEMYQADSAEIAAINKEVEELEHRIKAMLEQVKSKNEQWGNN